MGTSCSRSTKQTKENTRNRARFSTESNSQIEKTTDAQEYHEEKTPTSTDSISQVHFCLGSAEDVRKVYEIDTKVIGKGKFSTVRKVSCQEDSSKLFCLKTVLLGSLSVNMHLQNMLSHELHIMKNFHHPLIVKCFEAFNDPKFVHFLMEDLEGGDLFTYLFSKPNNVLTEKEAKNILYGVFAAVNFLHKNGIVHRDLKPENLIFQDQTHTNLKLIDFGLSKDHQTKNMMTIVGSPLYVAPEVLSRKGYDQKCDVWSLGVILYLLLQGTVPFESAEIKELFDQIMNKPLEFVGSENISKEAKELIQLMLEKNPKKRISINEALNHEFFREVRQNIAAQYSQISKEILEGIRKNITDLESSSNVFHRLFAEYGLQNLENKEMKALDEAYKFFDRDLKGCISFEMFRQGIKDLGCKWSEEEINKIFNYFAAEDQKEISYQRFLICFFENNKIWTKKNAKRLLAKKITKQGIRKYLERRLINYKEQDIEDFQKYVQLLMNLIENDEEVEVKKIPQFCVNLH